MSAKLAHISSLNTQIPVLHKSSFPHTPNFTKSKSKQFKIFANLGDGELKPKEKEKKKFITREQEPEQYWQSAGERAGENPMMTPLPYIIIFGMSTPFVILALGFANGWIKVPIR